MSLLNDGAVVVNLLPAVDAANTAAATGSGVPISAYEGFLEITQNIGTVTGGSISGKIQECDDTAGNNPVDVTGATFTQITTSNDPATQMIRVPLGLITKSHIRYIGTIATGPAAVGVTMRAKAKYI